MVREVGRKETRDQLTSQGSVISGETKCIPAIGLLLEDIQRQRLKSEGGCEAR